MISLARHLAMRAEIEEQFSDLAGRLGRRDGERLRCGAKWRGRTDADRARIAAAIREEMNRPWPHSETCKTLDRLLRVVEGK